MSDEQIFLGRQPILDRKQNIVAYELLFRAGQTINANVLDDMHATADVITRAFTDLGVAAVLGRHKGFINVHGELLLSDMLELLPKDKVVIELLETVEVTPVVIERCKDLKAMGFTLAVDDYTSEDKQFDALFNLVDIVKLDYPLISKEKLPSVVQHLKRWPVKLLAEKIDDHNQSQQCMELGFHLFQGYYFAKPVILTGKRADPSKLALLRLLGIVLSDDADPSEIEQIFKRDPSLSYKLLQLVNSVGMGLAQKISSLHHAIAILGLQQLRRWIQLMMFIPNKGDSGDNPLMQLAATRGKLMELLAKVQLPGDKSYQDRAFIAGILSLLDTLMGISMEEIAEQINLPPDVRQALLERGGALGNLLLLSEKNECGDFNAVGEMVESSNLKISDLLQAQMAAMNWANELTQIH